MSPVNGTEPALLEVKNLSKHFPVRTGIGGKKNVIRAVDGVSFQIAQGRTFSVVGESGCGKSTIGRSIMRLFPPSAGEVCFRGENIFTMGKKRFARIRPLMQMIFQDPYSSLDPRMTVGELVAEGVQKHGIVPQAELWDYAISVLEDCGIPGEHADRFPHEFSGGQRQRICIARTLALRPDLIVCDEPVSALDVSIQAQIINLLQDLQKQRGIAYLFISHDLAVVKHISHEVAVMYLGKIVEQADKHTLYAQSAHPYTRSLLGAIPALKPGGIKNRIVLSGDIPAPDAIPQGCGFHTRCPECMEICKTEAPAMIPIAEHHFAACHRVKAKS